MKHESIRSRKNFLKLSAIITRLIERWRARPLACRAIILAALVVPAGLHAGQGPALVFRMDSLERSSGECPGKPCVTLRVRYPQIVALRPARFQDSLTVFIQETLLGKHDPRGVAPILNAVLDSLAAQHRSLPADQAAMPWLVERSIAVIGDTLGIVTLDVEEFRSSGGAHPLSMHLLYMLEPSTMRMLSLDDLVPPEKKGMLKEKAEKAFRMARHIQPGATLESAGFTFPADKFELTLNVGLTRDGLIFHYNPYEIAPYVMGPTRVTVPWKSLAGVLRAPSPPAR
ncbi:MAG TPA: RsiV family protein [Bacteroidota bacterium]|nr:RsiV family protein [Bacteroidota bacterium]